METRCSNMFPTSFVSDRLKARENIDKYCEKFEKDMLHLFDRAYRRGDPKMMHVSPPVSFKALVSDNHTSIAPKHCWTSMVARRVCKYT